LSEGLGWVWLFQRLPSTHTMEAASRKRPFDGDTPVAIKKRAVSSANDSPVAIPSPSPLTEEPRDESELEVRALPPTFPLTFLLPSRDPQNILSGSSESHWARRSASVMPLSGIVRVWRAYG
jgi:hypothetical protein